MAVNLGAVLVGVLVATGWNRFEEYGYLYTELDPEDAGAIIEKLEQEPLSTRELKRLYERYAQAPRGQRQRLVENPEQALSKKVAESFMGEREAGADDAP